MCVRLCVPITEGVCMRVWCVYVCVYVCICMFFCECLYLVGCLRWWNVVHPETPLGFFLNWRVKKTAKQAIFANFHDINTYDTCIGRAFHWYTKNMCTHCCEFHCIHRNLRRVEVSETITYSVCVYWNRRILCLLQGLSARRLAFSHSCKIT